MTLKLGIMGGTFDPIHMGHLACAEIAHDACGLDEVLFVVAGQPHFKQGQELAAAEDRLAMVRAAIADNEAFSATDEEIVREGITYTADTLAILARKRPDAELFFIMGTDSLVTLPTWREPERIAKLARIICVSRPGSFIDEILKERLDRLGFEVIFVEAPLLDISSSEIRARVARGQTVRYLVPEAARTYLERASLYGSALDPESVGTCPVPRGAR